jgi:hypothetical protein
LKHDDRSPSLVELRIEPIAQIEFTVDVWLVQRVVEEVVDGHGEVVRWIQDGWICVSFLQLVPRDRRLLSFVLTFCLVSRGFKE